jgi:ankyrin repeat protein
MSGGVSRSSSFKGLTHSSSAPTFSGGAKSKLKSGKKLNKDEVGFLEAAQKGDIDAIIECTSKTNFFKKSIVDVNCSDSLGRNALMLAAISGKFTAVEYLLNRLKVDAEAQDVVNQTKFFTTL